MKNIIAALVVTLLASTAAFAEDAKKHENKTPINNVAAEGIKDTNAASAEGDLTDHQAHKIKRKLKGVEKTEQKNADLRHGLVSKGDHKKFNAKAHKVNAERDATIEKNIEEKDAKSEEKKN